MKLKELLDKFDGNTVISIKYGQATVFLEQGLENILDDEDYPCYADVEVETFSIRTSEIIDMAPLLYISLHAESYDVSDNITEYVRSAWSLAAHISKSGLIIAGQSGMDGGNNVIRLPDKTTFNWKSRDRVVRVNCKEPAMKLIEGNTKLHHFENGPADPSRPYSFFIGTYSDLVACLAALNKEESNRI